ncbi:class I SAM-dependent methyltransferase [Streptomyces sp. NBC_01565]|uniref:class I SAM-dependent methyltransferase n=1 Tax=unclassified Streptomyces TaxID=2593676 RepID=UPI002259D6A4|nr:class I SAM-dependent methyltransferase [Streptomyces sp. NBC_01565]MCX4546328.1 class I SAM-dependent methyltransferase [Streptomyces sp. NBC_01565]
MTRGQVFGEVAELYDATRPGYADALVSQVLAYAALGERGAVEVGAGTGKATVLFAESGTPLVCIEPDPRMAQVLRRNTAGHPGVRVERGRFEEWRSGGRRFGLLLAATSWHWVDPERRWDLAHDALAPGGAVALFWNPQGVRDAGLHAALAEVDRRHGIANAPHGEMASSYGDVPGDWAGLPGWPEEECRRDGRFTDLRAFRYGQSQYYETDRYVGYLASLSGYRVLPSDRREQVLAETARVLDSHGGGIGMEHFSDLFLARVR